jgi:predicted kinase
VKALKRSRLTPPFVAISGLAASGKTTVAEPLARALDIPLISKDAIKEALFEPSATPTRRGRNH